MLNTLLIRADASQAMGTGHIMRMLALAQAWISEGGISILVTSDNCPPALLERIEKTFTGVKLLPASEAGLKADASFLKSLAIQTGAAALAVDGYHFREDYQNALAGVGARTLWTDDFGHCLSWNCDFTLNQNLHGTACRLNGRSRLLGGARFALLRSDILRHIPKFSNSQPVEKILLSMGGADPDNVTSIMLRALDRITDRILEVIVLVGSANSHCKEIGALIMDSKHNCSLMQNAADMGKLYMSVDGVIGACGSSCYEWLYFGLPAFAVTLADNQEKVSAELASRHLACCPGWLTGMSEEQLAGSITEWLENPSAYDSPVDGLGAWRVANVLAGCEWAVRPARLSDFKFTFSLANEPTVREAGFHTGNISEKDHTQWFTAQLSSPASRIFIIEDPVTGPLGVIRAHFKLDAWELGISLAPEARGRNLANLALQEFLGILERENYHTFRAIIRPENKNSLRLFKRLGFNLIEALPDRTCWELTKNKP